MPIPSAVDVPSAKAPYFRAIGGNTEGRLLTFVVIFETTGVMEPVALPQKRAIH